MERTAFRVEPELLEQADRIVQRAEQDPDRLFVPTRAAVLRAALRRGLAALSGDVDAAERAA